MMQRSARTVGSAGDCRLVAAHQASSPPAVNWLSLTGRWRRAMEGRGPAGWPGLPYEAALALHDASDEAAMRQALEIFIGLGAAAAHLTRHKMRRLGIRSIPAGPRTATQAGPLGLTRRECDVLDLICAGHSNDAPMSSRRLRRSGGRR